MLALGGGQTQTRLRCLPRRSPPAVRPRGGGPLLSRERFIYVKGKRRSVLCKCNRNTGNRKLLTATCLRKPTLQISDVSRVLKIITCRGPCVTRLPRAPGAHASWAPDRAARAPVSRRVIGSFNFRGCVWRTMARRCFRVIAAAGGRASEGSLAGQLGTVSVRLENKAASQRVFTTAPDLHAAPHGGGSAVAGRLDVNR